MIEPDFLSLADVLEIHADQIRRHGGNSSIRDLGLVDSATAVARSSFGGRYLHPTLYDMAAAYAYHISENQPFIDGNKRTGLAAALTFLKMNGVPVTDPRGALHAAMRKVGRGQLTKSGLAQVFRALHDKPRQEGTPGST